MHQNIIPTRQIADGQDKTRWLDPPYPNRLLVSHCLDDAQALKRLAVLQQVHLAVQSYLALRNELNQSMGIAWCSTTPTR